MLSLQKKYLSNPLACSGEVIRWLNASLGNKPAHFKQISPNKQTKNLDRVCYISIYIKIYLDYSEHHLQVEMWKMKPFFVIFLIGFWSAVCEYEKIFGNVKLIKQSVVKAAQWIILCCKQMFTFSLVFVWFLEIQICSRVFLVVRDPAGCLSETDHSSKQRLSVRSNLS